MVDVSAAKAFTNLNKVVDQQASHKYVKVGAGGDGTFRLCHSSNVGKMKYWLANQFKKNKGVDHAATPKTAKENVAEVFKASTLEVAQARLGRPATVDQEKALNAVVDQLVGQHFPEGAGSGPSRVNVGSINAAKADLNVKLETLLPTLLDKPMPPMPSIPADGSTSAQPASSQSNYSQSNLSQSTSSPLQVRFGTQLKLAQARGAAMDKFEPKRLSVAPITSPIRPQSPPPERAILALQTLVVPTRERVIANYLACPQFANWRECKQHYDSVKQTGTKEEVADAKGKLAVALQQLNLLHKPVTAYLRQEFKDSQLYQLAQGEPNAKLFDSPPYFGSDHPAESLNSALNFVLLDPLKVHGLLSHGLTIEQAVAIYMQSQGPYFVVNGQLRDPPRHPNQVMQRFVSCVVDGLGVMPPYEGDVRRVVTLPKKVDEKYQVNKVVADRGILSTTANPDYTFGNINGTSHSITIKGSKNSAGRDISWLSESAHEKEVMFPPGTEFTVESRDGKIVLDKQYKGDGKRYLSTVQLVLTQD